MVITDELIAAYIDGNVTAEERLQVCRYLSLHPEEQDLVLALMDEVEDYSEVVDGEGATALQKEQSFTDIAYAAAAFAPRKAISYEANSNVLMNKSRERHLRMSALWDELQENE